MMHFNENIYLGKYLGTGMGSQVGHTLFYSASLCYCGFSCLVSTKIKILSAFCNSKMMDIYIFQVRNVLKLYFILRLCSQS